MQMAQCFSLTKPVTLQSVKYKNRVIYINGDPFLSWQTPLCYGYTVNDLSAWILEACAEYDLVASWDAAQFLAKKLRDQILKENFEAVEQGGYQLGWD